MESGARDRGLEFLCEEPGSPSGQSLAGAYRVFLRASFMGRYLGTGLRLMSLG